MGENIS